MKTRAMILGATLSLSLSIACQSQDSDTPQDPQANDKLALDCATTPKHTRCTSTPASYTGWHPSSIVSKIEIVADDSCCFDLDQDGTNDNALGQLLELAKGSGTDTSTFNQSLAASIQDGTIKLLVEHQYISAQGGDFAINYYLGKQDGDFSGPAANGINPYLVNTDSFSQGVMAGARMTNAKTANQTLEAGPGDVLITTALLGPPLTLRISAAQIKATVDNAKTQYQGQDSGVALTQGKLGGAVRLSDIFDGINQVYDAQCGCAPVSEPFIKYSSAELHKAACSAPQNDTSACEQDSLCVDIYAVCKLVGFATRVADINVDDLGADCKDAKTCNAISLATTFEAVGAQITGVYEDPDKTPSN